MGGNEGRWWIDLGEAVWNARYLRVFIIHKNTIMLVMTQEHRGIFGKNTVEMGGNGLGYPIQRGVNFGINMNF